MLSKIEFLLHLCAAQLEPDEVAGLEDEVWAIAPAMRKDTAVIKCMLMGITMPISWAIEMRVDCRVLLEVINCENEKERGTGILLALRVQLGGKIKPSTQIHSC
jgi:hypothetical protein